MFLLSEKVHVGSAMTDSRANFPPSPSELSAPGAFGGRDNPSQTPGTFSKTSRLWSYTFLSLEISCS